MESGEGGAGGYHQPAGGGSAFPLHDPGRRPSQGLQPVYTPYNPFLHASTSPFTPLPNPPDQSYTPGDLSSAGGQHATGSDSVLSPQTNGRGTVGAEVAALSALYRPGTGGSGTAGADMSMPDSAAPEVSPAPKVSQKADRSCKTSVVSHSDFPYPTCSRCKKRRDDCSYGEGVYVEETVEGTDQHKIAELEAKISSLELQLRSANASSARTTSPARTANPPVRVSVNRDFVPSLSQSITELLSSPEKAALSAFIVGDDRHLSFGTIDDRLGDGAFTDAFTAHLLDAAVKACDSKLAGLSSLSSRVPLYKASLHELDPADQVAVAPLFGVPTILLPDGTPSPPLFYQVGARREQMCRTLAARAMETAWAAGLCWPKTHKEVEALMGVMALTFHEEMDYAESRFFVRSAAGAFIDLRHSEMTQQKSASTTKELGIAIYARAMADAVISVRNRKPNLISPNELTDYLATAGVDIPDLVNPRLNEQVEEQLQGSLTWTALSELINSIFIHVVSCYRVFNQVTTPRQAGSASVLNFIRNLWTLLDQVHNAIQRLQQHLVSLTSPLPGSGDDPHVMDHAILLAVRADDTLVTLIMHVHNFLHLRRDGAPYWSEREDDEELAKIRGESMLRVFKCLKLLAFYCQLHCSSQDKHSVFHVMLHLNVLPDWPRLVALRIGESGGPLSEEFEVTPDEGDWFRQALELSVFYSPRTAPMLQSLAIARAPRLARPMPPPTALSPPFSPSTAESPHFPPPPPPPPPQPLLHSPAALDLPQHTTTTSNPSHFSPSANPAYDFPSRVPHLPPGSALPLPPSDTRGLEESGTPFSLELYGQTGFADGASEDLTGASTDVRSAFSSVDWGDLSLTPAVGSDGSSSSVEEWMRRKQ
ncbi:hypothetical protein JCM10213v2_001019 [Rhodosporidiobolus nylandii]